MQCTRVITFSTTRAIQNKHTVPHQCTRRGVVHNAYSNLAVPHADVQGAMKKMSLQTTPYLTPRESIKLSKLVLYVVQAQYS